MKMPGKFTTVFFTLGTTLFLGACTSLSQPAASSSGPMASLPKGTVLTYDRTSTGSYGSGRADVVWTVADAVWQGKPVMASVSPQAGSSLYDPKTHAILAIIGINGQPVYSYSPPLAYQWPLQVGKTWTSKMDMTIHARGEVVPVTMEYRVEDFREIVVPAGKFKSYLVVSTDNFGEVHRVWVSPESALATVKRSLLRPANHPMGAGTLEGELKTLIKPR